MAQDKTDKTDKTPVLKHEINYPEAVEQTKALFQRWSDSDEIWTMCGENAAARFIIYNPEFVLEWAVSDAEGFDVLRSGVSGLLSSGTELHPAITDWLVKHLRGEASRPNAQAGRKGSGYAHFKIQFAIRRLICEGMIATRNDASLPSSACDVVADALAELGWEPRTFNGVKRVWLAQEGLASRDGVPVEQQLAQFSRHDPKG